MQWLCDPDARQVFEPSHGHVVEADDSVYLKGKYTGSDSVSPADAPYSPERCEDLTLVDYSKTGQKK